MKPSTARDEKQEKPRKGEVHSSSLPGLSVFLHHSLARCRSLFAERLLANFRSRVLSGGHHVRYWLPQTRAASG